MFLVKIKINRSCETQCTRMELKIKMATAKLGRRNPFGIPISFQPRTSFYEIWLQNGTDNKEN